MLQTTSVVDSLTLHSGIEFDIGTTARPDHFQLVNYNLEENLN